jgi:thiol-disulfide isomerase/thioredoxin/uncharacterized membrane protein YphA (DoxX/SURF4 family)
MMWRVNGLVVSLRCLLAVVFAVAATGKLLDLDGSRRALEEFGVRPRFARAGGVALPIAELTVAVTLLIAPTARWGAAGALVLLVVFMVAVARAMAQGRAPECHCFGQIHSEQAGASTLVRNAILGCLAIVVIVAGPGPSLNGVLAGLSTTQVALVAVSVAAVLLGLAVFQLWGDRRRLIRDLHAALAARGPAGLRRGTPAPDFSLAPVRGDAGSLDDLMTPKRPTVLIFVTTQCPPCLQMFPMLARWQDSLADALALPAIFSGDRDDVERISEEQGLSVALAQDDEEAFGLYNLRATPSAVLIDGDRLVASVPAEGVPAIEALIRTAVRQTGPPDLVVHHT